VSLNRRTTHLDPTTTTWDIDALSAPVKANGAAPLAMWSTSPMIPPWVNATTRRPGPSAPRTAPLPGSRPSAAPRSPAGRSGPPRRPSDGGGHLPSRPVRPRAGQRRPVAPARSDGRAGRQSVRSVSAWRRRRRRCPPGRGAHPRARPAPHHRRSAPGRLGRRPAGTGSPAGTAPTGRGGPAAGQAPPMVARSGSGGTRRPRAPGDSTGPKQPRLSTRGRSIQLCSAARSSVALRLARPGPRPARAAGGGAAPRRSGWC